MAIRDLCYYGSEKSYHRRVICRHMESDVFVRIAIDEVKEHGTGENSRIKDPESKEKRAYVAICAFSQPARTAR